MSFKSIFTVAGSSILAATVLGATTASALTFSALSAQFDDADDLLRLAGTIATVDAATREDLVIDFDGTPAAYDWSQAGLVSSSIGGTFFDGRAINVTHGVGLADVNGAPFTAGTTFDILFRLPGATGVFIGTDVDFFLCDDCVGFTLATQENVNNAVLVTAADLSLPAAVPLPAGGALILSGLAGLGGLGALRRRRRHPARR